MGLKRLPFSPPSYTESEAEAVKRCIQNSWTGTGPETAAFESEFAFYKGANSAIGLSSCTAALFLSLKSLGIGPGDEVITSAMTFCSTVNVILHCGAKPVLADVDPISHNISAELIQPKITPRTKAIIPVHYAGYPCDMDAIVDLCNEHQIYIVEDCAHAIESIYKGIHCGLFGETGCFSFYATKNIAMGEGGAVISKHQGILDDIALLRLHGLSRDAWRRFEQSSRQQYDVTKIGYKMNLTDLQSAIGRCQLSRIEEMYTHREMLWNNYNENLQGLGLELPSLPSDPLSRHARHLYAIGLPHDINRDEFVWRASNEFQVTFGVHYNSIPTFSAYKTLFNGASAIDNFPVSFQWGKKTISLSLSAAVTVSDQDRIINCLKSLLSNS